MKEESPPGLGIAWLWQLPNDHPFYNAAIWHDAMYDAKIKNLLSDSSSKRIDKRFLALCLEASKNSKKLKMQAYLFYFLSRVWGSFRWSKL